MFSIIVKCRFFSGVKIKNILSDFDQSKRAAKRSFVKTALHDTESAKDLTRPINSDGEGVAEVASISLTLLFTEFPKNGTTLSLNGNFTSVILCVFISVTFCEGAKVGNAT